ncbi:hypothetical protein C4569_02955 [Candidatus Parcubacteria bacterium]|nr:MAG: hypothetical protein C4569_02955 [Candidatus Parcubacteria bacterium]
MAKHLRKKFLVKYPTKPISRNKKPYKPRKKNLDVEKIFEEKEKYKKIYGLSERELKRYARQAIITTEKPGAALLVKTETRLDNVIYRLGFAKNRKLARNYIRMGLVLVNENVVDDTNYHVSQKDVIRSNIPISDNSQKQKSGYGSWLVRSNGIGNIIHIPSYNEVKRKDLNVDFIIDYYAVT